MTYLTESWREYQALHPEYATTASLHRVASGPPRPSSSTWRSCKGGEGVAGASLDGLFSAGECPRTRAPRHPLPAPTPAERNRGGRDEVQPANHANAFMLLRNPTLTRRRSTPDGRRQLRESIMRVGQLHPIIRWHRVGPRPSSSMALPPRDPRRVGLEPCSSISVEHGPLEVLALASPPTPTSAPPRSRRSRRWTGLPIFRLSPTPA